ncbi:MAG TPA: T9SS type A sorting domain-containing protein [Candidatus Kapabacteria bacterium]|nr:T9SS type A sorting domain-containing protein [Candidatus Kapabacteria bacterium]
MCCTTWAQGGDSILILDAGNVQHADFTRDGRYMMTQAYDSARIWELKTGKRVGTAFPMRDPKTDHPIFYAFAAGDTSVISIVIIQDSTLIVRDWRSGATIGSLKVFRQVYSTDITDSGREMIVGVTVPKLQYERWNIATGHYDGALNQIDVNQFEILTDYPGKYALLRNPGTYDILRLRVPDNHVDTFVTKESFIRELSYTSDGSRLAISRQYDPPLVFDVDANDTLFALKMLYNPDTIALMVMDIVPGNRWIVSLTRRYNQTPALDLWSGLDGMHIREFARDTLLRGTTIRMSPKGDYAVIFTTPRGTILWPLSLAATVPASPGASGMVDIAAYPNPIRGEVHVRCRIAGAHSARMRLVSMLGETVDARTMEQSAPGGFEGVIPTRGLAAGAYLCAVEAGGTSASIPVIVQE